MWQTPTSGETDIQSRDALKVDGIVVCAGIDSRHIAAQLGDRLNIYPVKGYSITINLDNTAGRAAAPLGA